MGDMNEFIKALLILGTIPIVTMVTSWIKRCEWKPEHKRLLAGAVSFVFAGLIAWADNKIDLTNIGGTGVIIVYGARSFYEFYFQRTDLNKTLEGAPQ
jgi:hypothetical protein